MVNESKFVALTVVYYLEIILVLCCFYLVKRRINPKQPLSHANDNPQATVMGFNNRFSVNSEFERPSIFL